MCAYTVASGIYTDSLSHYGISVHRTGNGIVWSSLSCRSRIFSLSPFLALFQQISGKLAGRVGRSFGGFTESQIRTGVSGSGLSLVKRVKVDLVAAGQPAFAE